MTKAGEKPGEKAGEKARSKAEYDAFLAACPSRQLLDRISNKWVVLVLCALGGGGSGVPGAPDGARAMRYSEIARLLAGVSQKMLTQTLRSLERDGLLTRTVTPTVPVTVSYELTDLGLSLHELTRSLRYWAQSHMDEVFARREEYDVRAS
ncbi:winged helix-turn-helix transcriptional regulator [Streptomyces montanisoli]|uniref:Helix-turn-helix transcriptional regulator n=1 Tax=Streptomyces montanisoli TaxID=2798581 RepID=A0A940RYW3_9ACTN|nr:helix-turn-helix domain-containing protein [Streptomyces montanisoli]MBP0459114.1 helix-turn-helix transcriptional regulator [Streptomyces montanisoli]